MRIDPLQAWSTEDLARSLIAWQASPTLDLGELSEVWRQVLPLIRWRSPTERAQAFRLYFGPIGTVGGEPAPRYDESTSAEVLRPIGTPVLGASGNGWAPPEMQDGVWLRIRWGVGGVAPMEMIAPYPAFGGSLPMVADQLEVSVFFDFEARISPPFNVQSLPVFNAFTGPSELAPANDRGLGYVRTYELVDPTYIPVPAFAREVLVRVQTPAVAAPATVRATFYTGSQDIIQTWDTYDYGGPVGAPGDLFLYLSVPGNAMLLGLEDPAQDENVANVTWWMRP